MRVCAITAVLHAVLTTGSPVDDMILSALAPQTPSTHAPSPRSTQDTVQPTPAAILAQVHDSLELRHALGFARVAAPPPEVVPPAAPATALPAPAKPPAAVPPAAAPPAVDPLVAPAAPAAGIAPANQAVPPAPPAAAPVPLLAATTTIPSPPLMAADDFVTVQWVETHIGTLRTWVPKTQTFHFEAMSQAPLPGAGGPIGMGTLTGKTGQTQTIVMVVAAAPTPTVDSRTAIAVAVAVGLVGLAV